MLPKSSVSQTCIPPEEGLEPSSKLQIDLVGEEDKSSPVDLSHQVVQAQISVRTSSSSLCTLQTNQPCLEKHSAPDPSEFFRRRSETQDLHHDVERESGIQYKPPPLAVLNSSISINRDGGADAFGPQDSLRRLESSSFVELRYIADALSSLDDIVRRKEAALDRLGLNAQHAFQEVNELKMAYLRLKSHVVSTLSVMTQGLKLQVESITLKTRDFAQKHRDLISSFAKEKLIMLDKLRESELLAQTLEMKKREQSSTHREALLILHEKVKSLQIENRCNNKNSLEIVGQLQDILTMSWEKLDQAHRTNIKLEATNLLQIKEKARSENTVLSLKALLQEVEQKNLKLEEDGFAAIAELEVKYNIAGKQNSALYERLKILERENNALKEHCYSQDTRIYELTGTIARHHASLNRKTDNIVDSKNKNFVSVGNCLQTEDDDQALYLPTPSAVPITSTVSTASTASTSALPTASSGELVFSAPENKIYELIAGSVKKRKRDTIQKNSSQGRKMDTVAEITKERNGARTNLEKDSSKSLCFLVPPTFNDVSENSSDARAGFVSIDITTPLKKQNFPYAVQRKELSVPNSGCLNTIFHSCSPLHHEDQFSHSFSYLSPRLVQSQLNCECTPGPTLNSPIEISTSPRYKSQAFRESDTKSGSKNTIQPLSPSENRKRKQVLNHSVDGTSGNNRIYDYNESSEIKIAIKVHDYSNSNKTTNSSSRVKVDEACRPELLFTKHYFKSRVPASAFNSLQKNCTAGEWERQSKESSENSSTPRKQSTQSWRVIRDAVLSEENSLFIHPLDLEL